MIRLFTEFFDIQTRGKDDRIILTLAVLTLIFFTGAIIYAI